MRAFFALWFLFSCSPADIVSRGTDFPPLVWPLKQPLENTWIQTKILHYIFAHSLSLSTFLFAASRSLTHRNTHIYFEKWISHTFSLFCFNQQYHHQSSPSHTQYEKRYPSEEGKKRTRQIGRLCFSLAFFYLIITGIIIISAVSTVSTSTFLLNSSAYHHFLRTVFFLPFYHLAKVFAPFLCAYYYAHTHFIRSISAGDILTFYAAEMCRFQYAVAGLLVERHMTIFAVATMVTTHGEREWWWWLRRGG